jgi:hypothetical protein
VCLGGLQESGLRPTDAHGDASVVDTLIVRVASLNDVVGEGDVVALIRIDTRGAELPVIRGAQGDDPSLPTIIVFETGSRSTPHYAVRPEDIIETIHALEMRLSTMRR